MAVGNAAKRPRAAHLGPERRRPQVLDAALEIAVERGVSGISMTAVAERLEVTPPVVYACFGSRADLVLALLAREERRLLEGVLGALPPGPTLDDPERLLVEGFQALLRVVEEHPGSWVVVFAPQPDPVVATRFGRAREQVAARVGELMEPMLESAGVEDVARKLPVLVELFMGAGEGAVRALVGAGGEWKPDELGELFGRVVFRAFSAA